MSAVVTHLLTYTTAAGHAWCLSYDPGDEEAVVDALQHDLIRSVLTCEEACMIAGWIGAMRAREIKAATY